MDLRYYGYSLLHDTGQVELFVGDKVSFTCTYIPCKTEHNFCNLGVYYTKYVLSAVSATSSAVHGDVHIWNHVQIMDHVPFQRALIEKEWKQDAVVKSSQEPKPIFKLYH